MGSTTRSGSLYEKQGEVSNPIRGVIRETGKGQQQDQGRYKRDGGVDNHHQVSYKRDKGEVNNQIRGVIRETAGGGQQPEKKPQQPEEMGLTTKSGEFRKTRGGGK